MIYEYTPETDLARFAYDNWTDLLYGPRCGRTRLGPSLKILAGLAPVVAVRGLFTPCKNEPKSWAFPVAATNRKAKISPAREFFSSYRFFARVTKRSGGGACPTGRGRSLPCPRGSPPRSCSLARATPAKSRMRNAENANAARRSADNIGTDGSSEGDWPWRTMWLRCPSSLRCAGHSSDARRRADRLRIG